MNSHMNWIHWLGWGFSGTVVLTSILAASQGFGATRVKNTSFLGTNFTPSRDKAKLIGFFLHFANGWIFALVYVFAFHAFGMATWWFGAIIGLVQAIFVLTMLMPVLPALHPRMANEQYGPTVVRQLEPPGFLGLHYGWRTPISGLIAHAIFCLVLAGPS